MNKEVHYLNKLITYLGMNAASFAKSIGYDSPNRIYYVLRFRNGVSSDLANDIISVYDNINYSWLLTGEGEMLKDEIGSKSSDTSKEVELLYKPRPYIDSVYGSLGVPNGFALAVRADECEKISIPFIREYDFSLRCKGDSMINRNNPERSINDGDIIACKLWTSRTYLMWGSVYALSTTEGVVVKKIVESEKPGCIKCVSFNIEDGYTPYDMPIEEIYDWAIVISVISICNWN